MPISQFNNWNAPLARFGFPGDVFDGAPEPTGTASAISVNILCSTLTTLTVQQSYNTSNFYYQKQYVIQGGQLYTIQMPVVLPYFRVTILNEELVDQTYCNMNTSLVPQLTQSVDIRPLTGATDSVSITGAVDISGGAIDISNFPAQQLVTGENSNFTFYPTAANNTVSIYADGTQGVNVAGGWQYANINNSGKINWYCYYSPTPSTDYKVSQLTSMYTVINQQSTLGLATAQNPWIMIYTRPDSGTNSGGTFYKSKLFFGSNAHTDILGLKLLYTGEDPVDIHPEITGINRIQLQFNSALSDSKLLADVQNESIYLGTLQTTNNTSPANSFSFTMQEYGADWVKTPAVLPIENGAVVTSLTPTLNTAVYNQAVSAVSFTGTPYDMGENSLVDVLLLASGVVVNGSVRLDYSVDGTTWFPDNLNTYPITTTDLHYVIRGIKTASRYIRVSTGLASTFRATNLLMVFSSKRD
jgi:hypothetical protein